MSCRVASFRNSGKAGAARQLGLGDETVVAGQQGGDRVGIGKRRPQRVEAGAGAVVVLVGDDDGIALALAFERLLVALEQEFQPLLVRAPVGRQRDDLDVLSPALSLDV